MKKYDYIIIGLTELLVALWVIFKKKESKSVLLIDKKQRCYFFRQIGLLSILSPLLGKSNNFKTLVTNALKFSTNIYKKSFSQFLDNCGTCRIQKQRWRW